jgi:hypothetical protein
MTHPNAIRTTCTQSQWYTFQRLRNRYQQDHDLWSARMDIPPLYALALYALVLSAGPASAIERMQI